ncbi:cytochrome P450, partial [Colletotrichum cereale]
PYLSAVIKETLRLMYGLASRLPRIAPDEDILYQGTWTSPGTTQATRNPRGYAMSMSAYLVHANKRLYPEPTKFTPKRWLLRDGRQGRHLERYLLTFSRGSRQCLGMQLAYCELYVAIAALTLRIVKIMRLYSKRDADVVYDLKLALGMPERES